MAGAVIFRVDTREFTRTIRRYSQLSRKTPAEIVNKKLGWIARRALWYTPEVPVGRVASELGESKAQMLVKTKQGRWSRSRKHLKSFFGVGAGSQGAPLLALILQARARRAGKPSPWRGKSRQAGGQAMLEVMRTVYRARAKSVGFIKSGWLGAFNVFKQWAGAAVGGGALKGKAKQIGRPKGGGKPAEEAFWRAKGQIWNSADARHDTHGALIKEGRPALQKAFDEEMRSTQEEIEKRLRGDAHKCGIRTA